MCDNPLFLNVCTYPLGSKGSREDLYAITTFLMAKLSEEDESDWSMILRAVYVAFQWGRCPVAPVNHVAVSRARWGPVHCMVVPRTLRLTQNAP